MNNHRARKRAIRRLSEDQAIPYSVAARRVRLGGVPGDQGRTVYPATSDTFRSQLLAARERRAFDARVRDTRLAARLPDGRAQHLADRFPPTRGEPGTGVGLLYHDEERVAALAELYETVARARPDVVPSTGDLAWAAELGEETAVDNVCFALDRAVRRHADLRAAQHELDGDGTGDRTGDGTGARTASRGALHILDALLTVADDGHAPGTRVRLRHDPQQTGTILNACWDLTGPPLAYDIRLDGAAETRPVDPGALIVLSSAKPY